jgi:hypothetical protein
MQVGSDAIIDAAPALSSILWILARAFSSVVLKMVRCIITKGYESKMLVDISMLWMFNR